MPTPEENRAWWEREAKLEKISALGDLVLATVFGGMAVALSLSEHPLLGLGAGGVSGFLGRQAVLELEDASEILEMHAGHQGSTPVE